MLHYHQVAVLHTDKLSFTGYNKPYLKMILTFLFVIAKLIENNRFFKFVKPSRK